MDYLKLILNSIIIYLIYLLLIILLLFQNDKPDSSGLVACALAGGRLFLVDGIDPPAGPSHCEGSFVLTELGPGAPVRSLACVGENE